MVAAGTLRKLCQVRDLMRDCLDEELTLEDLSLEVNLSAWHFLRSFRQAFGETPHGFLTRMRLQRVKDLLTVVQRLLLDIIAISVCAVIAKANACQEVAAFEVSWPADANRLPELGPEQAEESIQ